MFVLALNFCRLQIFLIKTKVLHLETAYFQPVIFNRQILYFSCFLFLFEQGEIYTGKRSIRFIVKLVSGFQCIYLDLVWNKMKYVIMQNIDILGVFILNQQVGRKFEIVKNFRRPKFFGGLKFSLVQIFLS